MKPATPYWLYLLECEDGSWYTGIALDVIDRFVMHAIGAGAAYTRSHCPVRVLAAREYPDRSQALRAEYALKQLPKARKLGFFEVNETVMLHAHSLENRED